MKILAVFSDVLLSSGQKPWNKSAFFWSTHSWGHGPAYFLYPKTVPRNL